MTLLNDLPRPMLGMGTWAIGGPMRMGELALGWGDVDDRESRRAIARAADLGVRLFDTADAYGTGHSESLLGEVLGGRPEIAIATKFGFVIDPATRELTGNDASPTYIRAACEASLRRLRRELIDLYQLHIGDLEGDPAAAVQETLEGLAREGKIAAYGWSTDLAERPALWRPSALFRAVQLEHNVLAPNAAMMAGAFAAGRLALCRAPLAMGLLGGRYGQGSTMPAGDVRAGAPPWLRYYTDGRPSPAFLHRLDAVRELLRGGGRTLAQGALGWLWATSDAAVPIPGFRSVAQVEDNAGALAHGPLPATVVAEIARLLAEAQREAGPSQR